MTKQAKVPEQLLISRLQLLLAEQRTYYALFRTGIAIFTFAPTVIVFLIATNNYHHLFNYYWLSAIALGLLSGLSVIGALLANQANIKIRKVERMMKSVRAGNKFLADFLV